jgi:hypothetical protein
VAARGEHALLVEAAKIAEVLGTTLSEMFAQLERRAEAESVATTASAGASRS